MIVGYYSDYVDEEHVYDMYSIVPKKHDNIDTTVSEPLSMTCTKKT